MPEALTESFCERCGTRYEFKAPTRLNPLRRSRGLVSGLRNYIMSQDALADAVGDAMRSEEERLAARQLEAFHNSFNFCIDCRQYTCNSCWNEGAGRCRSCVPVPGKDDLMERLEASFAAGAGTEASASGGVVDGGLSDAARAVGAEAWPSADIRNGHQVLDWPAAELSDDSDVGRRGATQSPSSIDNWTADASPPTLSDLVWPSTRRQASEPEPEPAVADIEPEPAVAEFEPEPAVAEFEPEPAVAEFEPEPAVADIEPEPAVAEFEPEPAPGVAPVPLSWDDDQPFELVAPEQPAWMAGLDDPSIRFAEAPLVGEEELPPVSAPAAGMTTASEQEPEGLEISPEPVVVDLAAQPEPTVAEVEPILAEVQPEWSAAGIGQTPEPEPVAAEVAPEPEPEPVETEVAPEPESAPVETEVAPEPEPEPVAAEAQPEPVVVEQPPRILRPLERRDAAPAPRPVAPRSDERIAAAAERQDPALAARRAQLELLGLDQSGVESTAAQPPEVLPYRSSGAGIHPAEAAGATPGLRSAAAIRASMWDASSREVAGAASAIGIQNCGGCGLSLSATARFCRRCGTRQARSA